MFLMFYISLSLAADDNYYDDDDGMTGCNCNNLGEKSGTYTCGEASGFCQSTSESDYFCSHKSDQGTSESNICKPGCVAEWEGTNRKGRPKNCYSDNFPDICTNNNCKDSNDKTAADGCPQCNECYATCDTFNCGNAGRREIPALCEGPCIFDDCCNYHFNFACDQNNFPQGQNPKWFSDMLLQGGEQGLMLEANIDNPFDRSIRYVVDSALDDTLASNAFLILEDCESTIMQSWKVFGYTISDGERIEITDRFGYGNPISNNGGIDNQRAVSNDLLLNGGDCENYQFVNLAKLMPSNDAAEMVETFSEFSKVEVEATMSSTAASFRGLLKVNLRCIAEESGEARESTVCTSIENCDAGMYCNKESDASVGVCEERFENILRCNEGPQNFWTRNSDGTTPICHDFNPHMFTSGRHISFPCVKIQIPEFSDLIPWEGTVGYPNPLHTGENDEPDWSQFRGWQIHMCGTEAELPDEVGFGILMRDTRYATENILHVRNSDYSTLKQTNLASGNGVDATRCRTLNVNKEDFVHSPGFSWETFESRSIRRQQYEIWIYQYPLGDCDADVESCEPGKSSLIIDETSNLYMNQTIQIEFLCDQPPPQTTTTTIPPPAPQPYLKEASRELRNAWWDVFVSYIRAQAEMGVDISFQIVNAVRNAFHDMLMGDKEENGVPMGCLIRIGMHDPAVKPFMDLMTGLALDLWTLQRTGKLLSAADYSVILGALCIDWTSTEAQNSYDWNENDNLLHKIRVGRSDVKPTRCFERKDELEGRLPKQEVQIEDPDTGELRPSSPEEPLFNRNELEDIRAGVQTWKGRMTAAHEEFKRAMLAGALTIRDAVALMGGHGLGFIRMLAEWAPLASEDDLEDSEDDCSLLRGGPWTTRPHVFDNEYFIILQDLLEVAESNMDAWTEMEPASTIWGAQDAINWIFRCVEDIPKIPVDTAKPLLGSEDRWSPIDPTIIGPDDDDPRFNSKLQMLDADLSLVFANDTLGFVKEFANREISFFDAFHTAYIKLSEHTKENLIPYIHPDGKPESLPKRNPQPTSQPTATDPSSTPSQLPSPTKPSQSPSSTPSTDEPTNSPTTEIPTHLPTTPSPSKQPSMAPSPSPSPEPTSAPSTDEPTNIPTTAIPTYFPTISSPSRQPNLSPSPEPTPEPTSAPSTDEPTNIPTTAIPTYLPTTPSPSRQPSISPSPAPTPEPTSAPTTADPSLNPSISIPSRTPSKAPSTDTPTYRPTIPPYPYTIYRWARMIRRGTCKFEHQPNDYRIGFGSYSSESACKRSCEQNERCLSLTYRDRKSCELYKYIPSMSFSYKHGGKFSCWMYDGGKGVQPLYHWMGWGNCFTDNGSSMSPFRTITAPSLESCMQHCRNENCLSVTWSYSGPFCRLHRDYAPRSCHGKDKYSQDETCYNILYNY